MDFERIFPFLVIYFIWRIFFKAKKKKPEIEKPEAAAADKADISVSPVDVLKQMLFGGIEMPDALKQERTGEVLPEEPLQHIPEKYYPEEQQPAFAETDVSVPRGRRPPEGEPIRETAQSLKDTFTTPVYSRKDLQKAVVWAEILAPPLGLRGE